MNTKEIKECQLLGEIENILIEYGTWTPQDKLQFRKHELALVSNALLNLFRENNEQE